MIYDCFTFFNEHTILDIRLNTLYDHVDKFIIVEATRSHQNLEKKLFFSEKKHEYSKFLDKIIHVVLDEYPEHTYWSYEENQRDAIIKELSKIATEDDIVFISDVDEIWNPEMIDLNNVESDKIYKWPSYVCFRYFNLMAQKELWYQPLYCKFSILDKMCNKEKLKFSYDVFRNRGNKIDKNSYIELNTISGWHLSYTEDIENKLQNFLHSEYRNMSNEYFQKSIKSGVNPFSGNEVFLIDNIQDHLPEYVKNNIDKFSNYILI